MVDRSPSGRLEVAGPPLRYMHRCNWKMLVENQTDTCHPMVAHESSAGTAVKLWERTERHLTPHSDGRRGYHRLLRLTSLWRTWGSESGRTVTDIQGFTSRFTPTTRRSPGYYDQMVASYGKERAEAILSESRHNTIYFNIMIKGPIQQLRLFKPIAADKTLVKVTFTGWLTRRRCSWRERRCTTGSSMLRHLWLGMTI